MLGAFSVPKKRLAVHVSHKTIPMLGREELRNLFLDNQLNVLTQFNLYFLSKSKECATEMLHVAIDEIACWDIPNILVYLNGSAKELLTLIREESIPSDIASLEELLKECLSVIKGVTFPVDVESFVIGFHFMFMMGDNAIYRRFKKATDAIHVTAIQDEITSLLLFEFMAAVSGLSFYLCVEFSRISLCRRMKLQPNGYEGIVLTLQKWIHCS